MKKLTVLMLAVAMILSGTLVSAEEQITARYTKSVVLVDGTPVAFEAYNINDSNYFKLRDIAMAFSGKKADFSVSWSDADNCILIDSNEAYQPVGGELIKGDGLDKPAALSTVNVLAPYNGGFWPKFKVYNINGNNYFKLRDLGISLRFNVGWDEEKNTIIIDTLNRFVFPSDYEVDVWE